MRIKKRGSNTKNLSRFISAIAILIAIFFLIYIFEGNSLKSINSDIDNGLVNIKNKQNELNSIYEEINLTKISINEKQNQIDTEKDILEVSNTVLEQNSSELQQLKSGGNCNLHDPLFSEVEKFIKEDNSISENELIDNAKSQGIRCAYVMEMLTSGNCYPLIGFNTIDKGMIYFQPVTWITTGKSSYSYNAHIPDPSSKILVVW